MLHSVKLLERQGVAEEGGGGFPKTPNYKVGDSVMIKGYQGVGKIAYIKHRENVGVIIKEPSPLRVVTTIDDLIPKQGVAEGEVIPFRKKETTKPTTPTKPQKDNVKPISKDRYAKLSPNTMQGPNMGSVYENKPQVRKYSYERPDGSIATRYEVLDSEGRRVAGQGAEGFDDPKRATELLQRVSKPRG
jgi:hypothetical protein